MFLRREIDVEERIMEVLKKFEGQKFNGVTIAKVVRQYEVGDGRRVDIAVLKDDGSPILLVETKKKYEVRGFRVERRFVVTSEEVVGQAAAYAALLLKRRGVHVLFVATANDKQMALFYIPANITELVDWDAVGRREYGTVLKNFYEFRDEYLIFHGPHNNFSEEFFKELLDAVTGIYVKKFHIEQKRQEPSWALIEDLRGFVDFIAPYIEQAIAPGRRLRDDVAEKLEKIGHTPSPEELAREMAYVLMNKIIFYKVLERYYKMTELRPLYREGVVKTSSQYIRELNKRFEEAVETTEDFEAIFKTGVYDTAENDLVESEEVPKALDWLIGLLGYYEVERLGDVIGYIYEELIPAEERHRLGQFYTPRPIAELIVKWAVRSREDKVLDPGCGSGTFLVEAYKRLAELKLGRPFREIKHVPEDVHGQVLGQLYGIDINEFPAHLTAMNLAMKNVRAPSAEINVVVSDYFAIPPAAGRHVADKVKTPDGTRRVRTVYADFDAVVGNPPYTRWTEIPERTRELIQNVLDNEIKRYRLTPQVSRGVEPGIYVYWIMHSTRFLKEGGRLGMIISDSWLQTDYGKDFFRYLLDHYKIHAVIDISARVFPVPLVGACIVLLERCSREEERSDNRAVFAYLDVSGGAVSADEILKAIEDARRTGEAAVIGLPSGARLQIRVYRQGDLANYSGKIINLIFSAEDLLRRLEQSPLVVKLSQYFEPSYGNIRYLVYASRGEIRGPRNVGGNEFFYLTEEGARRFRIPQEFLHPLLPSSRYLKFFTFSREDWEELRRSGKQCYLFLCRRPISELPREVQEYIRLGEREIQLRSGSPVSQSQASKTRSEHKSLFVGWYDLGGVEETPVAASRYARYWHRFALIDFSVACDDDVMALVPRVRFNRQELKALLAYMNSSFAKLWIEARGRTAGGVAALALEASVLAEMPILDVKRLPEEKVRRLAQLFDELEREARRLGGADSAEAVFGSELARELTGRDVRPGVPGLFNTVMREIDREVARILDLEDEAVRAMALELAKRRLARAGEARREAIKGSEELKELRPKRRREGGSVITRRLDEYF